MSFAHEVKLEVLEDITKSECCKLAFLSSVIHACGELTKSGREFYLELKTDIEKVYIQGHRIPIDDELANMLAVLIDNSNFVNIIFIKFARNQYLLISRVILWQSSNQRQRA